MSQLFIALTFAPLVALAQANVSARQIADPLLPLPESLRSGAAVVPDNAPGKRLVLREGTNGLVCRADAPTPGFNVYCHPKEMDAFWTRFEQLAREGKSNAEIRDALGAEAIAGRLESLMGVTVYSLSGESAESSLPLMAVFLPNATFDSPGLSTERNHYRPWLMWAGTPFAHVMIPGK